MKSTSSRLMKKIAVIVFLTVLVMCVSVTGVPQEKSQSSKDETFKLSVGSNIVLVPVIVTDKQGNHVSGLKPEDFEIKENGETQKIDRLTEITSETSTVEKPHVASASVFTNEIVAEKPKKLEIITLDQVNVPFQNANDGHRMLVDFLSKSIDKDTLLALVALQSNGVKIIHDFTSDPSVLIDAIKKVQSTVGSRDSRALDALGENSQADLEALQLTALLNGTDFSNVSTPAQLLAAMRAASAENRARADASRTAQQGLITLEDFQQIAQYFGRVPGRKSLIWATTGFAFNLGADSGSTTRGTTNDDWQRTFRMLDDANIAVYPVDIVGLLPGVSSNVLAQETTALRNAGGPDGNVRARSAMMENATQIDPIQAVHDTMHRMADMTGGEPFYNSNDGAELFRRAGNDAGQYYMLAYYTKDDGKYGWRKLGVKVRQDGVKVRARSGFFFVDRKKDSDQSSVIKELKLALSSDIDFTSVPLRGQWQQVEQAGAQRKVHFMLSVPAGVATIDSEHENHISLEFIIAATDAAGKPQGNISQRFDTKLPPEGVDQIQKKGLDYANALTLAPGKYKVHFVVRDNLKTTLGSIVVPLEVK